ncbi:type VI secretion system secreted protein VgrG [Acidovorax delafieldii]|uniref:Type VI secretion system secreted protein VgrG n=1 Tax=Acidovorax delafieldii TaxID=47920 RepID=A0AAJ2EZZ0_ACIDE|nr:type VI secretion system secreted protein VgrG [Acidovorax delafieldii]MDR6836099.1 type VI secretion system secreted protein VgrG [Acidovorax delafieldii]MDR7364930.1 type VI secretion system secreted protein VgrG [Acidovorax delafieldii]
MTRRVTIQTPLGEQLQFRKLEGTEALSDLFSLEVDLVSPSKNIDPKALLGKAASVVVETEGLGKRYLSGLVTHFGMRGRIIAGLPTACVCGPGFGSPRAKPISRFSST